jgi:hypothetical protein
MGVKHQLFSYYYFRGSLNTSSGKARQLIERMRKAKAKGYRFMLDSGAFTYHGKGQKGAVPPPQAYFDEYYDFVCQNHDLFEVIVEFDVDEFVKVHEGRVVPKESEEGEYISVGQVDEWTNRLLDIPEIAPKVMPVYHAHRGDKWLNDWLVDPRSPLLGIASTITEGTTAFIAKAHRFGKFVHGFAQTRINTDMKYTPFDSVDSTTWLRADKYGGTCIFRNGRWIVLDHLNKAKRAIYKDWYESWGLDWKKIAKDDLKENRLATIIAWRELANSFEQKWFYSSGGKYPYMLQWLLDKGAMPDEHPMITRMRRDGLLK